MVAVISKPKYVVCYSGGHSSALCAIEAVRKHGKENVILLNHDLTSKVEAEDIKRFKREVAEYLGLEITYANHPNWDTHTPIQICKDLGLWKRGSGQILCTTMLKTTPFKNWMKTNDPDKINTYIYGFDDTPRELTRANRRSQIMGLEGYKTEYPLINWTRTIQSTKEVNIEPPMTYDKFAHANCFGCLKAGWQHWYIVYCERPDLWEEAKEAEDSIGYAIHKDANGAVFLEDKEELFSKMKSLGVVPTEHITPARFWADAKRLVKESELDDLELHDQGVCLDCTV